MTEVPSVSDGRFASDLDCPECGYSLRGLTSTRCPECGLDLDFVESGESVIPWQRARGLRRIPAFWKTAMLVTFRPRRFCRAVCQPVSYPAAVGFRFAAITHAFVGIAAVSLVVDHCSNGALVTNFAEFSAWWFLGVVAAAVYVALIVLTGMPGYLFHPPHLSVRRQNRALCLSNYGSAPLAFVLPLGLAVCALLVALDRPGDGDSTDMLDLGLLSLFLLGLGAWLACFWCWSLLAAHLLRSGIRRVILTWVWSWVSLLVAIGTLVFVYLMVYFVALVAYSVSG